MDWAGFIVARAFAVHLVVGNCSDAATLHEKEVEDQSCRYDDTANEWPSTFIVVFQVSISMGLDGFATCDQKEDERIDDKMLFRKMAHVDGRLQLAPDVLIYLPNIESVYAALLVLIVQGQPWRRLKRTVHGRRLTSSAPWRSVNLWNERRITKQKKR